MHIDMSNSTITLEQRKQNVVHVEEFRRGSADMPEED